MIIVVGSNKGGCSKTGTATNLAVAIKRKYKNKTVGLFNADKQRSAAKWHAERVAAGLNDIELVEAFGNVAEAVHAAGKRLDYVIVDVAGRNSEELLTAGIVADLLLSPLQSSQDDCDTVDELVIQIEEIRKVNPNLPVLMLQTMAVTNPVIRGAERADFLGFIEAYPQLVAAESVTCWRKIYRDCRSAGTGVVETTNANAKKEINDLVKEVLKYEKA